MISFQQDMGTILLSVRPMRLTNTGPREDRNAFLTNRNFEIALAMKTISLLCLFDVDRMPACSIARSMFNKGWLETSRQPVALRNRSEDFISILRCAP